MTKRVTKNYRRTHPYDFYAFDFLNTLNHSDPPYTVQLSAATRFLVVKTFLNQFHLLQQFAPLFEKHPATQIYPDLFKPRALPMMHPLFWKTRWLAGSAAEREAVLNQLEHDLLTYL